MKTISHRLSDQFTELQILPLADLHIGDIHSDGQKILEWIEYIRTTPNCYCILNGDLMDTAIKTSIGDVYGASLHPMQQLEQCVKLFDPIREKILGITPGNHEARIFRNDSLDTTLLMATQLGIADRYSPASLLLFIRFGKQSKRHDERPVCYTCLQTHGTGGGRLEGGKVGRLMQLASIVDADIYIHSHTHLPAIVKSAYYRTSLENDSVRKVDKLFINTSSSLEYGGYGEVQCYKPNSIETPMIILDGAQHRMRAIL